MVRSRVLSRFVVPLSAAALLLAGCASPRNVSLAPGAEQTARNEQASAQASAQIVPITIHATAFHMDPSAVTVPVGRPIQISFENSDTVTHQLLIPQMPAKVLSTSDAAQIARDTNPDAVASILKNAPTGEVKIEATAGQKVETTFVATEPGTYDLRCVLPGHADAGMVTKVFVTGSASSAPAPAATAAPAAATPAATGAAMDGHVMAPPSTEGTARAARDAQLAPVEAGTVKQVTFDVTDTNVAIAPGVTLSAWTFGGQIPGPVIHVRQGDTVQFTLNNHSTMAHSIDFHAARTAPNVNYKNVAPGQSFTFTWTAKDPGIFMYHCGTAPILQHLAEGMYGAVVVDPVDQPLPAVDREFVFVQSEFYLGAAQNGITPADYQKAQTGQADVVVFNGYANQYADHPLAVKVGEKIRVYLVNAGPNHFSAFHVVGTIFDHVWVDGNPRNDMQGVQTWTVAPGEGSAFDLTLSEPGTYPMVSHSFADATKGAVAVFKAEK